MTNRSTTTTVNGSMIRSTEVVFIDPTVSDLEVLRSALRPDVEAIMLDSGRAAVAQIADVLERRPAGTVHVIAHGRPGEVSFSTGALCAENLTEYSDHLERIGEALAGARLLLWSCQTAEGERGAAFVDALAQAMGAEVAAATGLVGHAARGGDWILDARTGTSEGVTPLTAEGMTRYEGVMPIGISSISPDNGSKTNDLITSATTISVTGTGANTGDTISVTIGTQTFTTTAASGGGWTVTGFSGLADGSYTITATDVTTSTTVNNKAVTIDTTKPTTTVTSFAQNSGSTSDNITNQTKINLSGTTELGATVKVVEDGTTTFTVTADNKTGAWTVNNIALTEGSHSFVASATDLAGNVGSASSAFVIVDDQTKPGTPTISTVTDDVNPVVGTIALNGSTNDNTPTVRVTLSGTGATAPVAGDTVTLTAGAVKTTVTLASNDIQNGYVDIISSSLPDAKYNLTATVTDVAGNASAASAAFTITVDTAAPAAPTISTITPDTGTNTADHITSATALTLTGTAEKSSTVTIYDGTSSLGTVAADSTTGTWTFATTVATADATHHFTATATDAASNTGSASADFAVTVDVTQPNAPVISSFSPDTGVTGDAITSVTSLTLTGTAEASSTVKIFDGSGTTAISTTTADSSGNWTAITTGTLADGSHTLTATATDVAGNTGSASAAFNVSIDTTTSISTISISPDLGLSNTDAITSATTLNLKGTAEPGDTVVVMEGATLVGSATADSTGNWSVASTFSEGSHTLTATATDEAGNTASTTLTAVVDTTPPTTTINSFTQDTGSNSTDHLTSATTITLSGHDPSEQQGRGVRRHYRPGQCPC